MFRGEAAGGRRPRLAIARRRRVDADDGDEARWVGCDAVAVPGWKGAAHIAAHISRNALASGLRDADENRG
jgi:hypothetical protein